jgi:hypothetical protein
MYVHEVVVQDQGGGLTMNKRGKSHPHAHISRLQNRFHHHASCLDLSSMIALPFHKGFHGGYEAVGRIASHKRDDMRLVRHRSVELVGSSSYLTTRR